MEQVVDADGVVVGRVGPVVDFHVELLVVEDHVVESLSERQMAVLFKLVVDVLVGQEEVSCFKRDHH